MREETVSRICSMLSEKGFQVSTFLHLNSCFDIAARNGQTLLLVKVYSNIDSIRPEQGFELKKLGNALNATAIIVGEKTKAFELKEGIVYERYDVPVVSLETFGNFLSKELPTVKYFKGRNIVELDYESLRDKRKKLGLSQEELAGKISTTPESIHRYESGKPTSLEIAGRLEKELKTRLVRPVDIFENRKFDERIFESRLGDELLEKVRKLGLDIALFEHSPFEAYSKYEQPLFISRGERGVEIARKAIEIGKAEKVMKGKGMILSREFSKDMVENVPVVSSDDLSTLNRKKDLFELLKEKERKKRG